MRVKYAKIISVGKANKAEWSSIVEIYRILLHKEIKSVNNSFNKFYPVEKTNSCQMRKWKEIIVHFELEFHIFYAIRDQL